MRLLRVGDRAGADRRRRAFPARWQAVGSIEPPRGAWTPLSASTPDAYWWLAYEWANLYFSCEVCNRNKRNQFPVIGERAPTGATGRALRKELALLIDPCVDRPEWYMAYDRPE